MYGKKIYKLDNEKVFSVIVLFIDDYRKISGFLNRLVDQSGLGFEKNSDQVRR